MKCALLVVAITLGCGKANDVPGEAWGTEDYARAGIHIDKPWTPSDYKTAAEVLSNHRDRLPHFHDPKSGAVFAKLATPIEDGSASVAQRFGAHLTRIEALDGLAKLYVVDERAPVSRDFIELEGQNLGEAVFMARDGDAFIASFGPDDPKHDARVGGLAKIKSGAAEMIIGSLQIATDPRLTEENRIAMLTRVTAVLHDLVPFVGPEPQRQIREMIATQVTAVPAGALHDAYVAAQRALPST